MGYFSSVESGDKVCPSCGHVETLINLHEYLRPEVAKLAKEMEDLLREKEGLSDSST